MSTDVCEFCFARGLEASLLFGAWKLRYCLVQLRSCSSLQRRVPGPEVPGLKDVGCCFTTCGSEVVVVVVAVALI